MFGQSPSREGSLMGSLLDANWGGSFPSLGPRPPLDGATPKPDMGWASGPTPAWLPGWLFSPSAHGADSICPGPWRG